MGPNEVEDGEAVARTAGPWQDRSLNGAGVVPLLTPPGRNLENL
ncbi:hypothetical protein AB395_00006227 (plasmid) [Sinorhizobium fredii CCBAU 45436]|nr:hypothetical protein AB395_00006227 [Sinorhizobium fredii CCBAU 45436]